MRIKKIACMVMTYIIAVNCFCLPALAVGKNDDSTSTPVVRATGKFSMIVPKNKTIQASSSFPLEAGETVTIRAVYSPEFASVDFGLIAPDGFFYSINTQSGEIEGTIEVSQRGKYTFAVRNNSSNSVDVSGYVSCSIK